MKFAYADPPYIGQAKKHYGSDAEVDHAELIKHMTEDFPDGWALSCSSPSLAQIIPMLPEGCRVMAWVKPFASFKPGVNPAYAWEPVIVYGGRARGRGLPTVRDWVSANITLERGLSGAKPKEFCLWLFDVLNIQPGDELIDIFPGTEAVTMAFKEYFSQQTLETPPKRLGYHDVEEYYAENEETPPKDASPHPDGRDAKAKGGNP